MNNIQVYSATKLVTSRNISIGGKDFVGNANFDGSGNIILNGAINHCTINIGSTDPNPYKRVAHIKVSNSWNDNALLLYINQGYSGGKFGLCRVDFRTNDIQNNDNAGGGVSIRWLIRSGYSTDSVQAGYYIHLKNAYVDVFVKTTGAYQGTVIRVIQDSRGSVNNYFSLINSSTDREAYTSLSAAAIKLYNIAYQGTVSGYDDGVVKYSNSTSNADMVDNCHVAKWNGLPIVDNAGVMEIGKYIDFHNTKEDSVDYSTRIVCTGVHKNIVNLPSVGGTLALTSDNVASASKVANALSWSGYSSGSYNGSAAKSISIPNNTNQLTNGAGFITASASITGNAATATKLQTARTIWGQSFNGTANVSGSITGVNNITMSNNSYLYGKNTGGTAIQLIAMASWNSIDIGRGALVHKYTTQVMGKTVALTASDDSGKNTKSVELSTAKLYSNVNIETEGGFLAHGGVTAYSSSDIRLKQNLHKLNYLNIIKTMGGSYGFTWRKDNKHSIGWIAQHVLTNPYMRDIVETDENGYYKINYWSPKLIATAFGAIEQVDDEVSKLKARVKHLEAEVKRLTNDNKLLISK